MSIINRDDKVFDIYKVEDEIGRGSFAVVREGTHKKTGQKVAIKIIEKQCLDEDERAALFNEVEILSQIDHPNVLKLSEIFD
jgi:serine/threonine protein kinase